MAVLAEYKHKKLASRQKQKLARYKFYKWPKSQNEQKCKTYLYMVMGGIPHYLKQVEPGKSAAQNINSICFQAGGLLYDEFDKLFVSLFDDSENHLKIITVLAKHK